MLRLVKKRTTEYVAPTVFKIHMVKSLLALEKNTYVALNYYNLPLGLMNPDPALEITSSRITHTVKKLSINQYHKIEYNPLPLKTGDVIPGFIQLYGKEKLPTDCEDEKKAYFKRLDHLGRVRCVHGVYERQSQLRHQLYPYCVAFTDSGCVLLNREYKPLGFDTRHYADYYKYPVSYLFQNLGIQQCHDIDHHIDVKLSINKKPLDLWLYNERFAPCGGSRYSENKIYTDDYFKAINVLMNLEIRNNPKMEKKQITV